MRPFLPMALALCALLPGTDEATAKLLDATPTAGLVDLLETVDREDVRMALWLRMLTGDGVEPQITTLRDPKTPEVLRYFILSSFEMTGNVDALDWAIAELIRGSERKNPLYFSVFGNHAPDWNVRAKPLVEIAMRDLDDPRHLVAHAASVFLRELLKAENDPHRAQAITEAQRFASGVGPYSLVMLRGVDGDYHATAREARGEMLQFRMKWITDAWRIVKIP